MLADGIGQVTRISGASSLDADEAAGSPTRSSATWSSSTRLGIPAIVHEEICAGLMAREATVFPQAIGLAGTFRPELIARDRRRDPRADAGERRPSRPLAGARRLPRPALGPARGDVRRGSRTSSARWAWPSSRGLQGDDLRDGRRRHRQALRRLRRVGGRHNWAPAHLPERELREVYLRPFEAAVRDAGLASVMNGYHELDGVPCGANRVAAHRAAARRVGLRRHRRRRTTSRCASSTTTTASPTERRRRRGDGAARRARRRAARHRLLRRAAARRALARGAVDDRRRRPRRCAACSTPKFRLGLFEQPYVDADRVALHTRHRRARSTLARHDRRATASCCSATTAHCRWSATAFDRRDRPQRRPTPATCSATTLRRPRRVAARAAGERRAARFTCRLERGVELDRPGRPRPRGHGARRPARRAPRRRVTFAEGCAVERRRPLGLRRRRGGRRVGRRRRPGDGRSRRAHRRRARRARAATCRRSTCPACRRNWCSPSPPPARRSCSCSSPGARSGRRAVHAAADAVLMAWLPGRAGRGGDRRRPRPARSARRQAAGQLPAQLGPDPGLLRAQGVGRPVALEGRVRRSRRTSRCTRSVTGSATRRSSSASTAIDGAVVTVDDIVEVDRHRHQHRRTRRRRGGAALHAATRWRRSPARCASCRRSARLTLGAGAAAPRDVPAAGRRARFHRLRPALRRRARRHRALRRHSAAAAHPAGRVVVAATAWPSRRPPAANESSVERL